MSLDNCCRNKSNSNNLGICFFEDLYTLFRLNIKRIVDKLNTYSFQPNSNCSIEENQTIKKSKVIKVLLSLSNKLNLLGDMFLIHHILNTKDEIQFNKNFEILIRESLKEENLIIYPQVNGKNIFKMKKLNSKALDFIEVLNILKKAHLVKQIFTEFENGEPSFNNINNEIYMDIAKDFYFFKNIIENGNFNFNYSGVMKYRSDILILCGLYGFLFNKLTKESDLLKLLSSCKNDDTRFLFSKITPMSGRFIEIKSSIDLIISSFLEKHQMSLDNFILKKDMIILNELNSYIWENQFLNMDKVSSNSLLNIRIPPWILKKINQLKISLINESCEKVLEKEKFIQHIKKGMALRTIKLDLENNKTSKKIYLRLLNMKHYSSAENLSNILKLVFRKKIFKILRDK